MKRPSFQFYPGDWLNDAALRMVSVSARGLWMDMLCLMHQGSPYGFLKVNHSTILPHNLARISGATLPEVEGWIAELEQHGVLRRDDAGVIFSSRMIRDEEIRASRAAGGSKGGNPKLLAIRDGLPKVVDKVNHDDNLTPTPSSSSSASSSSSQKQEKAYPSDALEPISDKAPSRGKSKKTDITFDDWEKALATADEEYISDDDCIYEWALAVDIHRDWIGLAIDAFCDRYRGKPKTYKDWRAAFRDHIRGDYLKIWRTTSDGPTLTTVGEQYLRAFEKRLANG